MPRLPARRCAPLQGKGGGLVSAYLTEPQVAQLLKPINARRVGRDGKGFSHVEAYDIRAHLNRIFGFGRWSDSVTSADLVFEDRNEGEKPTDKVKWSVCYRAIVRVSVCAPDGTLLAFYEDGATGEAKNQPSRGDAHDLALKTALSQALKRAAVNLGDQFGLSLYNKGSLKALVGAVLHTPANGEAADKKDDQDGVDADVDAHITEQLAPEDEAPGEARERTPQAQTVTPDGGDDLAKSIAIRLAAGPATITDQQDRPRWIGSLLREASKGKCLAALIDTDDGPVPLKTLLEAAIGADRAA